MSKRKKFTARGKCEKTKEWVYGYVVKRGGEWYIDYETTDWNSIPPLGKIIYHKVRVIEKSIGQYIGFPVSNCEPIYAGDILEYEFTENSCWGKKGVYKGYVRFDEGCFEVVHLRDNIMHHPDGGWRKLSEFDDIKSLIAWAENVKKIGNIHDHPELLQLK